MQIYCCRQDKTMVSDNFKRNLHHFNMKKVEHCEAELWSNILIFKTYITIYKTYINLSYIYS